MIYLCAVSFLGTYESANDFIFKKYEKDVRKYKLLTKKEEEALAKKIHKGDKKAEEAMINANLRLVIRIARTYNNLRANTQELISCGNIGLITAVKKYNPSFKIRFVYYAVWWIRKEINLGIIEEYNTTTYQYELNRLLNKLSNKFEIENQRPPEVDELSALSGYSQKAIEYNRVSCNKMYNQKIEQQHILEDEEDISDADCHGASDKYQDGSTSVMVDKILSCLTRREMDVIKMCFGIGCPEYGIGDIAIIFDLPYKRIEAIRKSALRTLKNNRNAIPDYVLENLRSTH